MKKKPLKEITISMEKVKLICDYYNIPLAVFFTDEEQLKELISKHGTRDRIMGEYRDALDRIKEIIEEVYR